MVTVNDLAGLSYRSPIFSGKPHNVSNNNNNSQKPLTPNRELRPEQSINANLKFSGNKDGDVFIKSTDVEPKESVDNKQGFFGWLFKDYRVDDHIYI